MFDTTDFNPWDDADRMAGMAFEMYENGQMDMALTQLEEAIEINPNNSAWLFNKGLTLDAMERYLEAIESFEQALELSPDDPEILNSLAVDYTRTGQYDRALRTFEHIQTVDPSFEPAYCNRIIAYTELDQHDKAEEMFYLAQQINPDCPICFYNIGNSLFSRQRYKRAIWCWQRTAQLEPTHPQIHFRIAQAYWADGDAENAQKYFLAELRVNPGDTDAILEFGIFLLKSDRIEPAKEKFNRCLELSPDFAPAKFYLGEIAMKQGNCEAAHQWFSAAQQNDRRLPGPAFRLAQLAVAAGDTKQAVKYLKDEYALSISDPEVLLTMGQMFMELGELDPATECFLRVVDEDNQNAQAFECLGRTLAQRKDYLGALQFFEHARRLGDHSAELAADSARINLSMYRICAAARTLELGLADHPDNAALRQLARKVHWMHLSRTAYRKFRSVPLFKRILQFMDDYRFRIRRVINSKRPSPSFPVTLNPRKIRK
ncbi:MAG: tetratricopeptide repeat protein [Phycisphaerae bacterium]|nr:tetratricopeptide repeat protein [Phycisphaerae bacterium]